MRFWAHTVARASFACLALVALACPSSAGDAKPLTTILLIAQPELRDPNFGDSVVLVMNHLATGPKGIIVNRPTRVTVASVFPHIQQLARLDDKVYFGGPVDIRSVTFLVRAESAPQNAVAVLDGVYLSADGELLQELLRRERPMEGLRVYIGYSGWAPGQLEAEIARGSWKLAPADSSAIFDNKSERPWPAQDTPSAGRRT
jgi:putative transcriptional regulator